MSAALAEVLRIKSSLAAMMATGLSNVSGPEMDQLKERLSALQLGSAARLLDSADSAGAPGRFEAMVKLNHLLDQVELRLTTFPQIDHEGYEEAAGYPNIRVPIGAPLNEAPSYASLISIREPLRKSTYIYRYLKTMSDADICESYLQFFGHVHSVVPLVEIAKERGHLVEPLLSNVFRLRNRQAKINGLRFLKRLGDSAFATFLGSYDSLINNLPGRDANEVLYSRVLRIHYEDTLLYLRDRQAYEKMTLASQSRLEEIGLIFHRAVSEGDSYCHHLLGQFSPMRPEIDQYIALATARLPGSNRKLCPQLFLNLAILADEKFLLKVWKGKDLPEMKVLAEAYGWYADLANIDEVARFYIDTPSSPRGQLALGLMQELAVPKLKEMLSDKTLFKRDSLHEVGCEVMPAEMKAVYTRIIQSSATTYELEKAVKYSPRLNDRDLNEILKNKASEWLKSPNKKIAEFGKEKAGLLSGIKRFFSS